MAAHAKVRAALDVSFRSAGLDVDVYLQGSYRNYVNTKADSDVDIVAELSSVCEHDTSYLSFWEAQHFWANMTYSNYSYDRFRSDVQNVLRKVFGDAVVEHSKAIEVKGNWTRMKVDVLPVLRYRQVHGYDGVNISAYDGIAFWVEGRRIVNWPRQHFDNGVAKNQAANENFKPAVRMIKNARRVAVEHGLLQEGLAPSYFLQGLFWNVPNECFVADLSVTYCNTVNWLISNQAAHGWFKCQNGIDQLFGFSPEQWVTASAFQLEAALAALWNSWS
jgi:hypothetical protein